MNAVYKKKLETIQALKYFTEEVKIKYIKTLFEFFMEDFKFALNMVDYLVRNIHFNYSLIG